MGDEWNSDDDYVAPTQQPERTSRNRNYDRSQQNVEKHGFNQSQTFTNTDWRKRSSNDAASDAEIMEIESNKVGKIIGRGGSKIRELESESQARIQIKKNDSSSFTSISISGGHDAKMKARSLIEALLEDQPRQRFQTDRPRQSYEKRNENGESYSYQNASSNDSHHQGNSHASNNRYAYDQGDDFDWTKALENSLKLQEEHWAALPPIMKDFYVEDPKVATMSPQQVAQWREDNNNVNVTLVCDGDPSALPKIPNPVRTFEEAFSVYPEILEEIRKQNFVHPSPIQGQAWPVLLSGRDLIGIAQTGTGKTLAFLLPALIHTFRQPTPMDQRRGPNVLILAPTRELAIQIEKEVKKYEYKGIKSVCVYGGASRRDQINVVSKGVQIVIATPGRLNDLVKAKHLNVEAVTYLVLDEADRMLDMGFGPQIRVSLLEIRPTRQTVMTSATWPEGVQRLAQSYMKDPVQVVVGTLDLAAVHTVKQELIFTEDDIADKFQLLLEFFETMETMDKVIVFCGRVATAIGISSDLALKGLKYQSIYGSLEQCDREQALEDMRVGNANILIATDIASRGIDIENITHIINFDFPHNMEEYVHRVGRTGRAGRAGTAITYITRRDWAKAEGLIKILEEAGQEVPAELVNMADRFNKKKETSVGRGGGRGGFRGGFRR